MRPESFPSSNRSVSGHAGVSSDWLIQHARVLRSDGRRLELEVERRSTCGGCAARNGCGTGVLSEWLGRKPTRLIVYSDLGAAPGDMAVVALEQGELTRAALAIYLVPLLGFVGLPLLVRWGFPAAGEAVEIFAGLVGLVVAVMFVRSRLRHRAPQPVLLDVLRVASAGQAPVEMPGRPDDPPHPHRNR